MPRADEFELIERYFAPLAGRDDAGISCFQFKDDAACLNIPDDKDLVITQDALTENVHFFDNDPAKLIAQKALRTNLSDLIAKGAKPFSYSLALGLPKNFDEQFIAQFAEGLGEDQARFGLSLSGGDTFKVGANDTGKVGANGTGKVGANGTGGLTVAITALGLVDKGAYVSRLGAQVGDLILASGTIGDAALGLQLRLGNLKNLNQAHDAHLKSRYLLPQPRIELVEVIQRYASAAMDISDGLVGDLLKLLKASSVCAEIELAKVPLSDAAKALPDHIKTCIAGGDDYELLFTIAPKDLEDVQHFADQAGVAVTPIGKITKSSAGDNNSLDIMDETGKILSLDKTAYVHF